MLLLLDENFCWAAKNATAVPAARRRVRPSVYTARLRLLRQLNASDPTSTVFFCSGWLIADDLVATAAHCVYETNDAALTDPEDLYGISGEPWYTRAGLDGAVGRLIAVFGYNGPAAAVSCGAETCPDAYAAPTYVDTSYSVVSVVRGAVYQGWADLLDFDAYQGLDIALLQLEASVDTNAYEPYCWQQQAAGTYWRNMGYPAETQQGDLITSDIDANDAPRPMTDILPDLTVNDMYGLSASSESGMSGGPVFAGPHSRVVAALTSGIVIDASDTPVCPVLVKMINKEHALTSLVRRFGREVSCSAAENRWRAETNTKWNFSEKNKPRFTNYCLLFLF